MRWPRRSSRSTTLRVPVEAFDDAAYQQGYTIDPAQRQAISRLCETAGRGVYCLGSGRRGKSWLMAHISRRCPPPARDACTSTSSSVNCMPRFVDTGTIWMRRSTPSSMASMSCASTSSTSTTSPTRSSSNVSSGPLRPEHRPRRDLELSPAPPTAESPVPRHLRADDRVDRAVAGRCRRRWPRTIGPRRITSPASRRADGWCAAPPTHWPRWGSSPGTDERSTLVPCGHPLVALRAEAHCLWSTSTTCASAPPRRADYLKLAAEFDRWVVSGIPDLAHAGREAAQRFANLIDVCTTGTSKPRSWPTYPSKHSWPRDAVRSTSTES